MQAPRGTRNVDPYNLRPYFKRILQQVQPGFRISKQAADTLNEIMGDLTEDIVKGAIKIIDYEQQVTIYSQHIQLAIQILFPDQLAQQAITNGTKAVQTLTAAQPTSRRTSRAPSRAATAAPSAPAPAAAPSTPAAPAPSSIQQADGVRERRANIIISISRVENIIRSITDPENLRVGTDVPVYLAAVIDYISKEVLGLSGNVASDNNRVTIYSSDILAAIYNDAELRHIFADWVFQQIAASQQGQQPAQEEVTYEEEPGEASEELTRTT